MTYLRKDTVIGVINADRETSLLCYNKDYVKDIINFCYDSMIREIESLPQYKTDSVTETDDDWWEN